MPRQSGDGAFEWIFNSPSGVPGTNPYLDDYAGIFLIWDRLFGTFQDRDEPVLYSTLVTAVEPSGQTYSHGLPSHRRRQPKRLVQQGQDLVHAPAWMSGREQNPAALFDGPEEYDVDHAPPTLYIIANLGVLAIILGVMLSADSLRLLDTRWCLYPVAAMVWGGFFEGENGPSEGDRLVFVLALCGWFWSVGAELALGILVVAA